MNADTSQIAPTEANRPVAVGRTSAKRAPMNRPTLTRLTLAVGLVIGVVIGRLSAGGSGQPADRPRVATFRGGDIGAAAVRAALVQEPAALRSGHPEVARRILDDLVRTRILATLAREKGYDRDPEIAQRQAEQLAAAFVEKELEAPERAKPPTDDEVRAYLEAHRAEFDRPQRVRLAVISFPAATPAERDAKRARAKAALAEAKRREKDYYAFGELARRRSEDPNTASRQGELPIMSREDLIAAAGPELATAAFDVSEPGKVHPAVIETASGLFVLKLLGREPARNPSFDELRDTLRSRLANERLSERRKAFLERAWNEANVRVDEAALRDAIAGARGAQVTRLRRASAASRAARRTQSHRASCSADRGPRGACLERAQDEICLESSKAFGGRRTRRMVGQGLGKVLPSRTGFSGPEPA